MNTNSGFKFERLVVWQKAMKLTLFQSNEYAYCI